MGVDKAKLPWQKTTLLNHTLGIHKRCIEEVLIVCAENQDLPALSYSATILRDRDCAQGPIEGIITGLKYIGASELPVFVSSCDLPFLTERWIESLYSMFDSQDALIPKDENGNIHPLCGLYSTSTVEIFIQCKENQQRKLQRVLDRLKVRYLEANEMQAVDPSRKVLTNMNTPFDYQNALNQDQLAYLD